MVYTFYKYQANGNDFILIDNRKKVFKKNNTKLINKICDRKLGVGADGLILLEEDSLLDFKMTYINSDGSESGFCGNGSRCITHLSKILNIAHGEIKFSAIDGNHIAKFNYDNTVSVSMNDINISDFITYDNKFKTTFINSGSPHLIFLVNDVHEIDIYNEAKIIKHDYNSIYGGFNINFISINNKSFNMRTFERGVEDETLSCGSGVVAASCFLKFHKLFEKDSIKINMKGGELFTTIEKNNNIYNNIWLRGNVELVYVGNLKIR